MTNNRKQIVVKLICTILIWIIFCSFTAININFKSYLKYLNKRSEVLRKQNATSSSDIADLAVDPAAIAKADGPIFLGYKKSLVMKEKCKEKYGTSAKVVFVDSPEKTQYIVNGSQLSAGFWCVPYRLKCNFRTGYVVASPFGQICQSKYPNMFGGLEAGDIVACNNQLFPATGSTLWDGLYNEPVNPKTILMQSEDELLPCGKKRFYCKFGNDVHENKYVAHPLNRFHPIRNFCTQNLYQAHPSVKLNVSEKDWFCDCGEFITSRVRQPMLTRFGKCPCTSCVLTKTSESTFSVPYNCYTLYSRMSSVNKSRPCQLDGRFSKANSVPCETFTLNIGEVKEEDQMAPGLPFKLPNMKDIDNRNVRILTS